MKGELCIILNPYGIKTLIVDPGCMFAYHLWCLGGQLSNLYMREMKMGLLNARGGTINCKLRNFHLFNSIELVLFNVLLPGTTIDNIASLTP